MQRVRCCCHLGRRVIPADRNIIFPLTAAVFADIMNEGVGEGGFMSKTLAKLSDGFFAIGEGLDAVFSAILPFHAGVERPLAQKGLFFRSDEEAIAYDWQCICGDMKKVCGEMRIAFDKRKIEQDVH